MKKKLLLVLVLAISMVLAACGSDSKTEKTNTNQKEETTTESTETAKSEEANETVDGSEDTGEFHEEGFGTMKTVGVGYNDEVGIDGTDAEVKPIQMGSMNLYINGVGIFEVEPEEDAKTLLFNEQDKVKAIVVDMKVENTSEEDMTFQANQAIVVTDTGEQLESEIGLMGEAGGDFLGKVSKEGQTWYLLKNLDEDVKKVTVIFPAPFKTESWEDTGEEKRIEFDILSWEEAQKKDGK
ncbi:hypothetical protein [Niallia sp. MER 6]|uniref:hypothetical protein n=1 Tax=Niallia sp. MER 6 TaxID=2939567 RepID=UPI00204244F8|nr:hypothetical protein [Niallia sp. MER 6]MCM3030397.1 hypothetical protein [Niallia sp. MER 6]